MRPPSYPEMREERREFICKYTGLSGIEADHILEALYEKNIDPTVIDWEQAVSSAKEYGDRYRAVWDYLQNMYGITPPWSYSRIKEYEERYLPAEIEFNASRLKEYLEEQGHEYFKKVMDALCLGRGEVPEEIAREIRYTGEERRKFIDLLCEEYRRVRVRGDDWVIERYRRGIERFGGADVYIKCGREKIHGFLAVADCLHEAKLLNLTTENMVERYMEAM